MNIYKSATVEHGRTPRSKASATPDLPRSILKPASENAKTKDTSSASMPVSTRKRPGIQESSGLSATKQRNSSLAPHVGRHQIGARSRGLGSDLGLTETKVHDRSLVLAEEARHERERGMFASSGGLLSPPPSPVSPFSKSKTNWVAGRSKGYISVGPHTAKAGYLKSRTLAPKTVFTERTSPPTAPPAQSAGSWRKRALRAEASKADNHARAQVLGKMLQLNLGDDGWRTHIHEDGRGEDTPGADEDEATAPAGFASAQSGRALLVVSLEDFCKRYGVSATDQERLERLEFQPGDAIDTLPAEDWKVFAGFPTLAWRRIITKNNMFIHDVQNGLWV